MSKTKLCRHCNTKAPKIAKFCPKCGLKLKINIFRKIGMWVVCFFSFMIILFAATGDKDVVSLHDRTISFLSTINVYMFLIIIPIILIFNFMGIRKRLPLYKGNKVFPKIMASILSFVIIIVVLAITSSILESSYTPAYIAKRTISRAIIAKQEATDKLVKQKVAAKKKADQQVADNDKKASELAKAESNQLKKEQANIKSKAEQQVINAKKKAAELANQKLAAKKKADQKVADGKKKAEKKVADDKKKASELASQKDADQKEEAELQEADKKEQAKSKSSHNIFGWISNSYNSYMDNRRAIKQAKIDKKIADEKKKVADAKKKADKEKQDAANKAMLEIANADIKTDLSTTLASGDNFSLPSSVVAIVGGKHKNLPVKWNKPSPNTSNVGTNVITGTITGFSKQIKYTVRVVPFVLADSFRNVSTQNSMVSYNVVVDKFYVWFKVSKGNQTENQYVSCVNGDILQHTLYLHFGPGTYSIVVLTGDQERGTYFESKHFEIYNKDIRDMTYLLPSKYIESENKEIIALANNITKNCFSDMEKTSAIHDWVAKNISYDVAEYESQVHEHSSLETLHDKSAVCNGYANLTAALNRAVGIKTQVVTGTVTTSGSTGAHAWNATLINGKWINQDTTFDAGYLDSDTNEFVHEVTRDYFNPSASVFSKHTRISNEDPF